MTIYEKKWIVKTKRENFTPSSTAVLCNDHFEENDFEKRTLPSFLKSLALPEEAIKSVKPRLLPDAVPSKFNFNLYTGSGSSLTKSSTKNSTRPRGAIEKRERLKVLADVGLASTASKSKPRHNLRQKNLAEKEKVDQIQSSDDKSIQIIDTIELPQTEMLAGEVETEMNSIESQSTESTKSHNDLQLIIMDISKLKEAALKACSISPTLNLDFKHQKVVMKSVKIQTDSFTPQISSTPKKRKLEDSYEHSNCENSFSSLSSLSDSTFNETTCLDLNGSNSFKDYSSDVKGKKISHL